MYYIVMFVFLFLYCLPTVYARPRRVVPQTISSQEHNAIKEEGKTVVYRKRNIVEFDDSLIEGEVKNPTEFYFIHRPEEKFKNLISRRKNFHKEMLRDSVMLR